MKLLALTLCAALGFGAGAAIFDAKPAIELPPSADPAFDYYASSRKEQTKWMKTFAKRYMVGIQRVSLGETQWSYRYRLEPEYRRLVAMMEPMVERKRKAKPLDDESRRRLTAEWKDWLLTGCERVIEKSLLSGGVEVRYEVDVSVEGLPHIAVTLSQETCRDHVPQADRVPGQEKIVTELATYFTGSGPRPDVSVNVKGCVVKIRSTYGVDCKKSFMRKSQDSLIDLRGVSTLRPNPAPLAGYASVVGDKDPHDFRNSPDQSDSEKFHDLYLSIYGGPNTMNKPAPFKIANDRKYLKASREAGYHLARRDNICNGNTSLIAGGTRVTVGVKPQSEQRVIELLSELKEITCQ